MKVHKFTIHPDLPCLMPKGAMILSAAFQGHDLQVWAIVDPAAHKCERDIQVVATGQSLPEGKAVFIDTVHLLSEGLVFHIFDCGEV